MQNRETEDFESWIKFFLIGVERTSQTAVKTVKNIVIFFNLIFYNDS